MQKMMHKSEKKRMDALKSRPEKPVHDRAKKDMYMSEDKKERGEKGAMVNRRMSLPGGIERVLQRRGDMEVGQGGKMHYGNPEAKKAWKVEND